MSRTRCTADALGASGGVWARALAVVQSTSASDRTGHHRFVIESVIAVFLQRGHYADQLPIFEQIEVLQEIEVSRDLEIVGAQSVERRARGRGLRRGHDGLRRWRCRR